jgi:hypothetical protein
LGGLNFIKQSHGVNPLSEQEILYRRIPESLAERGKPSLSIFEAYKSADPDGLSLQRECCTPQGAAATGRAGRQYYTCQATVGDIEQIDGLTVFADSNEHALIPEINSDLRNSSDSAGALKAKQWARLL